MTKQNRFTEKKLSQEIRQKRFELKLTQKQLAEKVGCSRWTVVQWEAGKTSPGWLARKILSRLFEVNL